MSPEITGGATEFDASKSDIWACGVTLYNMLTGKYPFEFTDDGNVIELYEKITAAKIVYPEHLNLYVLDLFDGIYPML